MKSKELNDWSYDEVIDFCAGHILKKLIAGDLRGGVINCIELVQQWNPKTEKLKMRTTH
jgi:hypothetical protein